MRAHASVLCALVACTSGEAKPTKGRLTVAFPSTEAAVATDVIEVLVFDATEANRDFVCQDLITARLSSPASLEPKLPPAAADVCAMLAGQSPVTIPYGQHAFLAIAQRKDRNDDLKDFMIGCAVMTIGDGDAPLPIPVRLVSVNMPVPKTDCTTVAEFCGGQCEL